MMRLPSGKMNWSTCGLMFSSLISGFFSSQAISISESKWPMLQRMASSFIAFMCSPRDDVAAAGRGDEDVAVRRGLFHRRDLVALHRGLQRADGVDLGDDHAGAEAARAPARSPCRRRRSRATTTTLPANITSVARLMPSTSDSRQP